MNSSTGTALRPSWEELPGALRDGLADRLGAITTARVQDGGFTPGLAARLQLASGERLFAKGIPAGHRRAEPPRPPGPRGNRGPDVGGLPHRLGLTQCSPHPGG